MKGFLLLCFVFICLGASSAEAKRIALVIGNDNYFNVTKLQKAANDSQAIADILIDIGFEVIHYENLKNRIMNRAIYSDFLSKIQKGDEALFYYAGHAIEIKNRNYLLATDIPKVKPGNKRFLMKEAFAVDEIMTAMEEQGSRINIMILDACRNNPFPDDLVRALNSGGGLAKVEPPKGSFVMYSAGTRQTALDRLSDNDTNPNSVFTRKLLPLLKSPGMSISKMAKKLRKEVEELAISVNHNQYPAYYDQLRGEFYFVPPKKNKILSGNYKTKPLENEIKKNKLAKKIIDYQKQVEFILHTYKPRYLTDLKYSFQGCKTEMQYVDNSGRYKRHYAYSFTYDKLRGDIYLDRVWDAVKLILPIIGESKIIFDFRSAGKQDRGWSSGAPVFMLDRKNRKFNSLMFSLSKACAQDSLNTPTENESWFHDKQNDFF